MFRKALEEKDQEIYELQTEIRDMKFLFAGIVERCNDYKKKNVVIMHKALEEIKRLAEHGIDIKEADE